MVVRVPLQSRILTYILGQYYLWIAVAAGLFMQRGTSIANGDNDDDDFINTVQRKNWLKDHPSRSPPNSSEESN